MTRGWRFYVGLGFFVFAWIAPLFGFLVPLLDLPAAAETVIIGSLLVGGPEVAIVLAAVFWGKETLNYFKARLWAFFRRQFIDRPVSRPRYYTAIALQVATLVPVYLHLYAPAWLPFASLSADRVTLLVLNDLVFVVGVVLAGGQYWEKIRRLFTWDPEPARPERADPAPVP